MKGISTILAAAIVVLIMATMISLTYTFAVQQRTFVPESMQKNISIVIATCDDLSGNVRTFKFTIKNIGSKTINSNELAVFLDGKRMNESPAFSSLEPSVIDRERTFTNQTPAQGASGTHKIMVSSPAREVSQDVVCP